MRFGVSDFLPAAVHRSLGAATLWIAGAARTRGSVTSYTRSMSYAEKAMVSTAKERYVLQP